MKDAKRNDNLGKDKIFGIIVLHISHKFSHSGEECRESMSSSPSKQSRASHSSRSSPEVEKDKEKEKDGGRRHGPVHSQSVPILHGEKPPAPVKRVRRLLLFFFFRNYQIIEKKTCYSPTDLIWKSKLWTHNFFYCQTTWGILFV